MKLELEVKTVVILELINGAELKRCVFSFEQKVSIDWLSLISVGNMHSKGLEQRLRKPDHRFRMSMFWLNLKGVG